MPLEVHSAVKTTELIHYQLIDSFDRFEERQRRARRSQVHTFVWPIFSATVAIGLVQASRAVQGQFFAELAPWLLGAVLFVPLTFGFRRLSELSIGWFSEYRNKTRVLRSELSGDELRRFDQKTSNELLLAYSLVQSASAEGTEPESIPSVGLYLSESAYYLGKACKDLSLILGDKEKAAPYVATEDVTKKISRFAIDDNRLVWAVELAREVSDSILREIERRPELNANRIVKLVKNTQRVFLRLFEKTLDELGASG